MFIFCFSSLAFLGECGGVRGRAEGPVLGEGSWPLWAGLVSSGVTHFSLPVHKSEMQMNREEAQKIHVK